jgi:hypothetical protein
VLGLVLRIAGGLLAVVLGLGGLAYATDYGVEATVVEHRCGASTLLGGSGAGEATVRAKMLPTVRHTVTDLPSQVCNALHDGNLVVYHVRSGRTMLYDHDGGPCVYDSATRAACGG